MFLSDSALRRIAAETGDVWPEHLWRHDTATPGPTGVLAQLLHTVTLRFNERRAARPTPGDARRTGQQPA